MKPTNPSLFLLAFLFLVSACTPSQRIIAPQSTDDGLIDVIFLQINDVYEIAPLEGGKTGGMARVATLKKQLKKSNPNTLTVLSGDFLNPSVIGTLKYNNKAIKGAHMIEVMNHLGVDLVTFGNHEFDLKEAELQERLNESNAIWLGTNVLYKNEAVVHSFYQNQKDKRKYIQEMWIWEVEDADGTTAKIGFFSTTLNANPVDYVIYEDFKAEAIKAYQFLAQHTDLVIGVTHTTIAEDLELAALLPNVPLLMGGHEHSHMIHKVGNVTVTKADANAKSAYVHRFQINTKNKKSNLQSELVMLDESVALDPELSKIVNKWNDIADEIFKKEGFDIKEVLATLPEPLDGKESTMRHQQTNLGQLITKAMSDAYNNENDCSILNSGSIRIDDEISGQLTQFDVIRAMPFGGGLAKVTMTGTLLQTVLNEGANSTGSGAYLQWDKIKQVDGKGWKITGKPLQTDRNYTVVINDFLLRGLDIKSLKEGVDGIINIEKPEKENIKTDIRLVLIDYLKKK
ncbi:MAG: 5'-nucleotidase/UDP-sugar diphosphatase [Saprospiraceae bacterium]|jgi:5'-nucleotidase/UDP-sugar diphosphatase